MVSKKHRAVAAVTAVTAAATILLTGTFAWQSISQQAKNEVMSAVNPGGRLHDDFDGRNKDVYVENFTDPDDGGVPLYARVRLDEYMEIGAGAGQASGTEGKQAQSLVDGSVFDDVTTWKTHIPGDTIEGGATGDPFHTYWKWKTGGQTVYMPTFNKNKDSLKADINGTYEGTTPGDTIHFDDYKAYTAGEQKTGSAIYDADDNDIDDAGITTVEETHTAKATGTATILTMQDWLDAGAQPGPFWVWDEDGWAYWAEPIQPGEATGLLLDGIVLQKEPDDDWYYSINVVGQFATLGDWGNADSKTGFYKDGITEGALDLLNNIAGLNAEEEQTALTITAEGDATKALPGGSVQFSVAEAQEVEWSVSGGTSADTAIDENGLLTIGADEAAGTALTITATSVNASGSYIITVDQQSDSWDSAALAAITPGSTDTAQIDGREWYVLAKGDGKALIMAKEMEKTFGTKGNGKGQFDSRSDDEKNNWATSSVRTWLNGEYLNGLTTLGSHVADTTLTTRKEFNSEEWVETTDKVFLLSEADMAGTFNGTATTDARDYTYGNGKLVTNDEIRKCHKEGADYVNANTYWLRSPHTNTYMAAVCFADKGYVENVVITFQYGDNDLNTGVRPAMWVNLD